MLTFLLHIKQILCARRIEIMMLLSYANFFICSHLSQQNSHLHATILILQKPLNSTHVYLIRFISENDAYNYT